MIDEKKIEEAAEKYADDATKINTGLDWYDHANYGFKEGVNWTIQEFLKDLWHPAEEEPNHKAKRTYILGKTKTSESGVLPMLLRQNTDWKEFSLSRGVTRWLYIDDLLPKEGGKQ